MKAGTPLWIFRGCFANFTSTLPLIQQKNLPDSTVLAKRPDPRLMGCNKVVASPMVALPVASHCRVQTSKFRAVRSSLNKDTDGSFEIRIYNLKLVGSWLVLGLLNIVEVGSLNSHYLRQVL